MFARFSTLSALSVLAIATMVAAGPSGWHKPEEVVPKHDYKPEYQPEYQPEYKGESKNSLSAQCNTGSVQCCDTVEDASSDNAAKALGLLGLVVQGANVPIGLNCDSIDVLIGVGAGSNCASQPVCCDKTESGLGVGCLPINLAA